MTILITGGASGLGASIVKTLAMTGFTVYFTYARSADAAKEIEAAYPAARGIYCDFTDTASVDALLAQVATLSPDVLINNANGPIHKDHFHKIDAGVFLDSFTTNILPAIRITQEAIKVFRKKKFGKIINIISSYSLNKPPTGLSEYVANKAYMQSMSKSWANELIRYNITSNCISPSFMLTGLTADTDERIVEQMVADHPLKKLLTTDEVADTALFLVRSSQHINGVNLVMNAGSDVV
ncbi:MAG: SDR family oxidoreductase [Bacteroidota bacterium]